MVTFILLEDAPSSRCVVKSLAINIDVQMLLMIRHQSIIPMSKELASLTVVHNHTYGHMLQTIQRLVAVHHAHAIVAVEPPHPPMLVIITTVNQEIQAPVPLRVFCILVILSGMANSAVQRALAAAMDEPLHGLV